MNYAEQLRNEIANTNASIIAKEFEPRKAEILSIITEGIKRIGYVKIDVFGTHCDTAEGQRLGVKKETLNAFDEFIRKEGFRTQKGWWGYSTDGTADLLTIRL